MILNDQELKTHFDKEIARWFSVKGDYTHRLDYNLNQDSVLVDLGGYQGWWVEQMMPKYNCTMHVFEPVKSFYDIIVDKFRGNPKVNVYHCGLGTGDGDVQIFHSGDGTSLFVGQDNKSEIIHMRRADTFLNGLGFVDVLKINIEGAEYDLMEHLIDTGAIKNIRDVQVQFHTFMPNCQQRRNEIRRRLLETHKVTYNYDFVWENWTLK